MEPVYKAENRDNHVLSMSEELHAPAQQFKSL